MQTESCLRKLINGLLIIEKEKEWVICKKTFKRNNVMKIKAIIHPAEEGGYWAEVPALPGCITEGETMEEVINNLQDAIQGWLEVANESQSTDSTAQVVEIAV